MQNIWLPNIKIDKKKQNTSVCKNVSNLLTKEFYKEKWKSKFENLLSFKI